MTAVSKPVSTFWRQISSARRRAAAAAVLIALGVALFAASPVCDGLRGLSLDLLTALRWRAFGNAHPPASSPTVVVALDEETFASPPFAGTPTVTWTREIGRVLTALIDGGAAVVGFDVILPTSIEQSAVPFGDDTLGARLRGFDRDFLRALALGARAGKVVLGEVQHRDKPVLPAPGQRVAVGFGRNIRALNVYDDPDQVIRRVPLAFTVDGAPTPSMAAELAARAAGAAVPPPAAGAVPGTLTLNFAGGPGDIPTYSFADLHACLDKGTDFFRREFAGKIVLIGSVLDVEDRKITAKRFATAPESASGARCALPAPAAAQTFARGSIAGVYIHATAVNNLIRGDAIAEFGRLGAALAAFALALLAAAAALALAPGAAVLSVVGLAALWTAGAAFAFRGALALPLLEPLLAAVVALGATIGYRLVVANRTIAAEAAVRRAHEAEMASAAAIQRAMLPSLEEGSFGAFDVFPYMMPAREIGGDLYDVARLEPNRLMVSIGDVCGKGIPASLFMAITQTVMRLVVRAAEDFSAEINAANQMLVANNTEMMFATLFCALIDQDSGAVEYCNCGHCPALLLRRDADAFESLRNLGPPLAVSDRAKYVPRAIALAPGDMLFLYTDGVTEAENRRAELFGLARLEAALREVRGRPARAVVEHVVARVAEFAKGAPPSDDLTCVAIVRREG